MIPENYAKQVHPKATPKNCQIKVTSSQKDGWSVTFFATIFSYQRSDAQSENKLELSCTRKISIHCDCPQSKWPLSSDDG